MLIPRGLNERDFFEQVVLAYVDANGGASVALGANDTIVLYTGPDKLVLSKAGITAFNWDLAADQITRFGASVINTTETANFLDSVGLNDYFKEVYSDPRDVDNAWLYVWGKTSALFCEGDFQDAATAVCGADPKRIFRRFEQDALLRNKHLERINNRDIDLFREFNKISAYETYRLVCITEILEAKQHARNVDTPEAWENYRLRRKFFNAEREITLGTAAPLSADDKQRKRQILATHKLPKIMGFPTPKAMTAAISSHGLMHAGHGTV